MTAPHRAAPGALSPRLRRDAKARASRAHAHQALSVSPQAETRYVLDLQRIMGKLHAAVMHVVHREHLGKAPASALRQDADPPHVGVGKDLLRRMLRVVKPEVGAAFDRMAKTSDASSKRGSALVGITPKAVPGLAKVIAEARARNLELIANASADFIDQIRDVLEEHEGALPGRGISEERLAELRAAEERGEDVPGPKSLAEALQRRVDVSRSRAVLIARNETLSLHGELNAHRQQAAGVLRFRWISSADERVRKSHRELEGKTFSWDDDEREEEMAGLEVADDDEGDPAPTPGSAVNCRCTASPVLADLDGEESEAAEAPDEEEELASAAE